VALRKVSTADPSVDLKMTGACAEAGETVWTTSVAERAATDPEASIRARVALVTESTAVIVEVAPTTDAVRSSSNCVGVKSGDVVRFVVTTHTVG
jgi:hypothetical protein